MGSKKKVDQYNMAGELLQTFNSITAASQSVGATKQHIAVAVKSRTHYSKGFLWARHGTKLVTPDPKGKRRPLVEKYPKVDKYDRDGNFLETYTSIADAARSIGGQYQSVNHALESKTRYAKGFLWVYHGEPAPAPKQPPKRIRKKL